MSTPVYCGQCGAANPADNKFCGGCGKPLEAVETPAASPIAAPPTKADAPKSSSGAIIVFGVLGFFAFGVFVLTLTDPKNQPPAESAAVTEEVAPVVTEPEPTPVPPTPLKSHLIKEWEGNGTKKTESFTTTSHEWVVQWATGGEDSGTFSITVYDANDEMVALAANVMGEDNDKSVMRGAGTYYLDISATQPYKIRVLDWR